MKLSATLKNKQAVQKRQAARIRNLMADGAMGRTVKRLGLRTYTLMRGFAHVQSGALKTSVTLSYKQLSATNAIASVYLNPGVKNPRGGKPADYGKYENARGASHAFLDRTTAAMRNTEIVEINELTRIVIDGAGG